MQYFVKLLLLGLENPALLFGFCAPTEQPPHAWKRKELDNKPSILQYTAILNQSDKDSLLNILNTKSSLNIGEEMLTLNLESRPSVFSDTSGLEWESNKPVSKFHIVDEYWNLDKAFLLNEIEQSFLPCNGRELRHNIQRLFEVLKKECGIDFSQEGERLGNFEYYTPGKYIDAFDVKRNNYTTIILRKKNTIPEELIVNCAAENEGRWVSNEVKAFYPDSDELAFSADEPMIHYKIKVWEKESGVLVYASESAFMMDINIDMATTSHKVIHDPWTQTLQQNASKHKDDIQKIERITVASRYDVINVTSEQPVPWRKATQDGKKICISYKTAKTKGAFVPKTADRKGEIDSFQKVREYIEEKGIKKAVLADPFFSVKSASKLLGRISSASVEFNVITALASTDPDTSEKNTDVKEQCKIFINQNRNLLHPNLTVQNVLRGNNPAFHDRYLIRYFDDGHIDGFLLSNSLNSAGQYFPYVIAPLESEVCLEVAEYLQNLMNPVYQNKLPEIEQVQIETLYSPARNREETEPEKKCVLPQLLTGESRIKDAVHSGVKLNYFEDGSNAKSFTVLPGALPTIIPMLFQHWNSNSETAIIALGEALYHTYQGTYEAKEILQSIPNAIPRYVETILLLVEDVEERQKHGQKSIHSEQFAYWAIMNGNAEPGPISHWVDNPGHVYYKEEGYWWCLYKLLWLLNPEEFLHTLEAIKSPLMLSILIEYIALYDYDKGLHELLLKSKWEWMHDLGAEWVWRNCKSKNLDINAVLDSIETSMQLKQSAYLLSEAAFHARMLQANTPEADKVKAWELCIKLIERIAKLCNETEISNDEQINALGKVKDCEQTCNAWLILSIAQSIKDEAVRNAQLDRIINAYFNNNHSLPCNLDTDEQYIELVVKAAELRYKDTFEKYIGSKLLHWGALNDWMEPYFRDREYWRWSDSEKTVGWDVQFLNAYQKLGYKLSGKLKAYFDRAMSDPTLLV